MKRSTLTGGIAATSIVLLAAAALIIAGLMRSGPDEGKAEPAASDQSSPSQSGLAAADLNGDGIVYQSGMHPWIVEDEPGTCPICGMDLMPVRVDDATDGSVRIDPVTLQNIGVRTAQVRVEPMRSMVRTTGRFEADEQQLAVVSPKISGWIETLHVNFEGARVAKGQPLLEIYSPELLSTQEEYLLALRNRERLNGSGASADADRLLEAARRRLAYWDISEAQVRQLEESGQPQKTLTLYAPASGTVVSTQVVEGQRVAAGETLMRLSNLSSLWLMADVYEQDLAWVELGTEALIELPYQPGSSITGRVSYLYDALDPNTRTVRARITVPNPGLKLKPGMYATVTLSGRDTEPTPVVPAEAVIRSGGSEAVILALGDGRFHPTDVVTGVQSDGLVQILDGLDGSETVVTSAQFLIDSEARLQSVVSAMMGGPPEAGPDAMPDMPAAEPHAPAAADPHANH